MVSEAILSALGDVLGQTPISHPIALVFIRAVLLFLPPIGGGGSGLG